MKRLMLATLFSTAALAIPANAQSDPACAARDEIVAKLAQEFKENQQAVGMVDENAVLEVFVSDNGGSWTIIATGKDGKSCILSAGQDWESTTFIKGLDS